MLFSLRLTATSPLPTSWKDSLFRVGRLPFNLLCKSMTFFFKTNQFLCPLVMYLCGSSFSGIPVFVSCMEEFTFSNAVRLAAYQISLLLIIRFRHLSFVRFADLWSLCFAKFPHENANLHGLSVHIFLCDQLPHAERWSLFWWQASLTVRVYSKWGHLENTNQSHCRTKIEKINKRRISQSALGQKQFQQINECQTVKIDLKSKHCSYWLPEANSMLSFD